MTLCNKGNGEHIDFVHLWLQLAPWRKIYVSYMICKGKRNIYSSVRTDRTRFRMRRQTVKIRAGAADNNARCEDGTFLQIL